MGTRLNRLVFPFPLGLMILGRKWYPDYQRDISINYLPWKHESIHITNDVNNAVRVAMGDWVLSKDQEVTEHHQIRGNYTKVRVPEVISKVLFHFRCRFLWLICTPFVLIGCITAIKQSHVYCIFASPSLNGRGCGQGCIALKVCYCKRPGL